MDMSIQWRQKSTDSWEMTQSNPPSELPSDPIISTSSNPDERSSSPVTRTVSETQNDDSLFSQAAQQETEPIPRDIGMPKPEDMLITIPDSPSRVSMESDIDNHISSLRPEQHPKSRQRNEKSNVAELDLDDDEFEIPKGGGQDSDSSYVEETSQRRKKKAPSKSTSGKTSSKPRPMTKSNTQKASTVTKEPREVTAQKARPRKRGTTTNAASKRPKPVNKKFDQPDKVVPNSQPIHNGKQAKREKVARVPKTTFFTEPVDGDSTQATQTTAIKSNPGLKPGIITSKDQNLKSRSYVSPDLPTGMDDNDLWNLPGSPEKQDHNPLSNAHPKRRISPNASGDAVGPNSKKKRSPVHPGPQQGNAKKNTTRTYGQKITRRIGDTTSEYFHGQKDHEAQRHGLSKLTETKQLMDQTTGSSNEDMRSVPDNVVDDLVYIEEENNEDIKHERILSNILEKPALEVTTTDQVPRPGTNTTPMSPAERTPLNHPETDVQVVPEEELRLSTSVPNEINKQTKEAEPQALLQPVIPDGPRESSKSRVVQSKTNGSSSRKIPADGLDDHLNSPVRELPDRIDVIKGAGIKLNTDPAKRIHSSLPALHTDFGPNAHISDRQKGPIPSDEHHLYVGETEVCHQSHATPVRIDTRSRVTEQGSPLTHPKPLVADVATFESNPLRPVTYEKQLKSKLPARAQVPFNYDIPLTSQMTSDFEPQLVQASISPLAGRVNPQAPSFMISEGLDRPKNYQPISRAVLSPSSSVKRPVKRTENIISEAPRLYQKSIDFARRVAQNRKQADKSQVNEGTHGRGKQLPAKQPSWVKPDYATGHWDVSRPPPSKADNLGDFLGERPLRGHGRNPDKQEPKPEYETKWQDAVDAASGGVVDTLHFISTSLLEHLRTREQSVTAVVEEYKRNGTKISERLAKRQTGEWHQALTTAEQKCLELARAYEERSRKTQDFRAKCLSKHRNKAYAEWQRQAARIKNAVRAAREEATLG